MERLGMECFCFFSRVMDRLDRGKQGANEARCERSNLREQVGFEGRSEAPGTVLQWVPVLAPFMFVEFQVKSQVIGRRFLQSAKSGETS